MKATIRRANGDVIELEGSAEEIAIALDRDDAAPAPEIPAPPGIDTPPPGWFPRPGFGVPTAVYYGCQPVDTGDSLPTRWIVTATDAAPKAP